MPSRPCDAPGWTTPATWRRWVREHEREGSEPSSPMRYPAPATGSTS
jgi:hypothetical protein